jgi:predicted nucleic acid-binding protein
MPNGKMSCFADTNLIVYVTDPREPIKRSRVRDFLARIIRHHTLVLSPQSLNECYRAVTERRDLMSRNDARRFVGAWRPYCTAPYNFEVTQQAWRVQDRHGFSWCDCMLLASAIVARCEIFLSEDLQHNMKIFGMTVLNPLELDPSADFSGVK